MTEADYASDVDESDGGIERRHTAVRILLTLLFGVIARVVETVVWVIVLFELIWTLITRQAPSGRVRELANRIVTYYYRIGRYVTYNGARAPFPFDDFPESYEASEWSPASEDRGAPHAAPGEDWETEDEYRE
jgi:hypothetical protein